MFKRPRIGLLGLNPHNAEFRKGSEEITLIIQSVKSLKKNINITGPLISDITFVKDYNNYDVIVGMYHDQVLSPFKSIFKFDAINLTLGLKYLRASPDHGTAANLIGKKKADPMSLIKCVEFINKFGKKMNPKKSLGQNFLIDKNIIKKIISLVKIKIKILLKLAQVKGP